MFGTQKEIKRVGIYCRVSTAEQVEHGNWLEVQKEALLNHVKMNSDKYSLNPAHIFVDEWKSWWSKDQKDRPALYEMFQSAQRWEFDILLVWKIDRFFRKTLYLLEWVEALDKLGIGFISITQNFDTTHAFWKMMLQMMWVIAELERELIKERTQSGILAVMKKGKWWRWCVPFWYTKNWDWYLSINEEEAEIIKFVYHLLVEEGYSLNKIVNIFKERNIETPSFKGKIGEKRFEQLIHINHWHRTTIQRMLTNKIYTWVLIQNQWQQTRKKRKKVLKPESEWLISECPQIISEEMFQMAQKQLEKNRTYSKRNTKKSHDYMLSSLVHDKETWFTYVWYTSSKWTKNYRLNVRNKGKNYVAPKWISGNKIEPIIWEKIVKVLKNPELILQELEKIESNSKSRDIEGEIALLNQNKQKKRNHSKQLLELITDSWGLPIEDIKEMVQENQKIITKLDQEIEKLKKLRLTEAEKKKRLNDMKKLSERMISILDKQISYKGKMEICRLLIDKIVFDGCNLEIDLIVPDSNKENTKNKRWSSTARLDLVKNFFEEWNDFISKKELPNQDWFESSMSCYINGGSSGARTQDLPLKREKIQWSANFYTIFFRGCKTESLYSTTYRITLQSERKIFSFSGKSYSPQTRCPSQSLRNTILSSK